ncbi:phage GP46 family protein [Sphingomonas sp. AR_OL41]|uniref:phage GP46 family protein n=1 Tax=Sphingomonas sp. AR_OL41 TaxID=3042729 RepID=UPI002481505D|nr:phage GP46 family protein [Sphingomonas sp. AR_OL41]MDH7971793.1 phage GP46 family protein [Sphingomonas sp. AR_OL41]
MTDIALRFSPASQAADIAVQGGALASDDGLMTAIVISLFTHARARADDVLPQDGADLRGWWGDIGNADANDGIGSRLWLLVREKLLPTTALKARDICREALAWLVDDGVVRSVDVETAILPLSPANPTGALAIGVSISRPDGPSRERYDFVWDATGRSFSTL